MEKAQDESIIEGKCKTMATKDDTIARLLAQLAAHGVQPEIPNLPAIAQEQQATSVEGAKDGNVGGDPLTQQGTNSSEQKHDIPMEQNQRDPMPEASTDGNVGENGEQTATGEETAGGHSGNSTADNGNTSTAPSPSSNVTAPVPNPAVPVVEASPTVLAVNNTEQQDGVMHRNNLDSMADEEHEEAVEEGDEVTSNTHIDPKTGSPLRFCKSKQLKKSLVQQEQRAYHSPAASTITISKSPRLQEAARSSDGASTGE